MQCLLLKLFLKNLNNKEENKMKIIIVGGTGTIGSAVAKELSERHEVIKIGRQQGDIQVDVTDQESIITMYKRIASFDAMVATIGKIKFAPLTELKADDYAIGIQHKLMSQINLVLQGLNYINDGGSFTLTSGILSDDPIRCGSSASMVNGGIDAFVKAAAIEMPRGIRINSISPTVLTESWDKFGNYFHGFESTSSQRVAKAYSKSIEGAQTGQVYKVW
jgi:NAD(P)-dependent dehydrogenase (short-subunit alcohol dehydrogenase family)